MITAMDPPSSPAPGTSRLVANIMHFARILRAAGLPLGPGSVIEAVRAVLHVGLARRDDLYWTLHAVFVTRHDQRALFDQAFHLFWRDPRLLERMMALVLPATPADRQEDRRDVIRRLAEAMARDAPERAQQVADRLERDATGTASAIEQLNEMDFEQMSAEELTQAKAAIARMRLPVREIVTRRYAPSARGARADLRATLRASLRAGGSHIPLKLRQRQTRPPALVLLCDISGSMTRYSRMVLHFMHALTNDRDRVTSFVFGTRLTNITRYLRHRDVDFALARVAEQVEDWAGGTRIGHCLHGFNGDWARRVLAHGAVVLLITDGLDRDAGDGLAREMARLQRSCRRLIWLNPLLRYQGFEPKSLGIRAILPYVDDFRPVHNLDALSELAEVLSATASSDWHRLSPHADHRIEAA